MLKCLLPLSWIYEFALARRRAYWRQRPPWRLPVPVVSVGNITVGGTGKTEAVAYICHYAMAHGLKPGILSRGYQRQSVEEPLVVSRGQGAEVPVTEAGDEPYLLAQRLKGTAVVVGRDRMAAGLRAIRELKCSLLVLDDGFQRRDQLHRDLDIVLVDAADPFGGGALLPAGRLREPATALAEANLIILTRSDQYRVNSVLPLLSKLAPGVPVLTAQHTPANLISLDGKKKQSPEYLANRKVLAVSGIARPEAFQKTLENLGAEVTGHFIFRDHHWYSDGDRKRIYYHAVSLQSQIVTTAKDAVRLDWPKDFLVKGWVLGVAFDIASGASKLHSHLDKIFKG